MTNAVRHAHAERCDVQLRIDGTLTLEIADDGIGIPPTARGGVGLSSMRERAAELGGRVEIGCGQNRGCLVRAVLPLDPP